MPNMNLVMLMGHLVADADVVRLPSGTAVAKLRLAVDEEFSDTKGEKMKRTALVDVEAWGRIAEGCAGSLRKGSPVLIEGRLHNDEWEAADGKKKSRLMVKAQKIELQDATQLIESMEQSDTPF